MLNYRSMRHFAVIALMMAAPAVLGQTPSPAESSEDEATLVETALVTVDGQMLFRLRGISSFSATRRAEVVAERIVALARDPTFNPATLNISEGETATRIFAGNQLVLSVYDADARVEGIKRRVLADSNLTSIQTAISAYRRARTPQAMRRAALWCGLATLLAAVLIFSVMRMTVWVDSKLEQRYRQRMHGLAIQSLELVRAERIWGLVRGALHMIRGALILVVAFLYLRYVLGNLPWTRGAAERLDDWILAPLAYLVRGLGREIPDLIFLAVLFFVVRYLLRLLRLVFTAVGRREVRWSGFEPEWADPTFKLVRLAVVAFALVVAFPYIPGSESAAFKGVTIFIGIVFSLGSSSAIANVIAGYVMTYRRAFHEGDLIRIGESIGVVTQVRLQVTHLRTPKNEEIIIPNSTILGSEVVNYSTLAKSRGLILHTTVGIGYETPWRQVEAMLLQAAGQTPGLLKDPKPFVLQRSLGDFAVNYELNVYCDEPTAMMRLYTELHRRILDVFNEYGVQIMTPAYEGDPDQPKVVPRDQWHAAPAEQE
jgi:small-conductance mechanosensitive channel